VTPEAPTFAEAFGHRPPAAQWRVTREELAVAWDDLSTASGQGVDMVVFGSPHFSLGECRMLAQYVAEGHCHPGVEVLITTSQMVHEAASRIGLTAKLERFGARFVTDTCILTSPIVPERSRTLMTNSAKYAHYVPGLLGRDVYFGSMEDCARSAMSGRPIISEPVWLRP